MRKKRVLVKDPVSGPDGWSFCGSFFMARFWNDCNLSMVLPQARKQSDRRDAGEQLTFFVRGSSSLGFVTDAQSLSLVVHRAAP